jgi:hypothetical protein
MGGFSGISLFDEPVRILDTRTLNGGQGAPLQDGGEFGIEVAGHTFGSDSVPLNANGVIFNLTAAGPTGEGFLQVYPPVEPQTPIEQRPFTSTLNFAAGGHAVANGVISRMNGPWGQQFANNGIVVRAVVAAGGRVDVIVDLIGYTGPLA